MVMGLAFAYWTSRGDVQAHVPCSFDEIRSPEEDPQGQNGPHEVDQQNRSLLGVRSRSLLLLLLLAAPRGSLPDLHRRSGPQQFGRTTDCSRPVKAGLEQNMSDVDFLSI